MWQVQSALSFLFDLVMNLFQSWNPLLSLFFISLPVAIFMLLVFRYTSDQKGIKKSKDRIKAYLLEIRIFKDDLGILLSAQKRLLMYNGIYLSHAIKPLLVMIVPMALLILQMDAWYGHRPLMPGESTILSSQVSEETRTRLLSTASIEAERGVTVEKPSLRIFETGELDWTIRAREAGVHQIRVTVAGHSFPKKIVVSGGGLARVSTLSINTGFWRAIFTPGAEPLPENAFLKNIEVRYPSRSVKILGWKIHWLIIFFVFTTVIAFSLKRFFRVEL
jgi:uncharacterized membrane protein (DUF106 family)